MMRQAQDEDLVMLWSKYSAVVVIMGNTSPSIEPFRATYRQDTLSGACSTKISIWTISSEIKLKE